MKSKMRKVVYWQIVKLGTGCTDIKLWTKEDQSNAIQERFVKLTDDTIRARIEDILGLKHFDLEQVR